MAQWIQPSTLTQTGGDTSNTDIPGHELPDASAPSMPVYHARRAVPPLNAGTQGHSDQNVCIVCLAHFSTNNKLQEHGLKENHSPYGCICGSNFSRLGSLGRHISSFNGVRGILCKLCAKEFDRKDHLYQHLRTFHKIPAGRIPKDFDVDTHEPQGSNHPQPWPQYPCPVQSGTRTGEDGFLTQSDLHGHYALQNSMPVQQGATDSASTWVGGDLHQYDHSQLPIQNTSGYGMQQETQGDDMFGESMGYQPQSGYYDYGSNYNFQD